MLERLQKVLTGRNLGISFLLIFALAAFLKFLSPEHPERYPLPRFLHNNYLIFTKPFGLMLEQKTAYGKHEDLFDDFYRYSPTFTFLMGTFHYLPVGLGVVLWSLLNTAVLVAGIFRFLKDEPDSSKATVLLIVFFDALSATQHMQTNNLIAGMILLGVSWLREGKPFLAAMLFCLCGFIKLYGMGAAIFFLFFPHKTKFLLAMGFWIVVLAALPLTIVPVDFLVEEYLGWFENFKYHVNVQLSVMGILGSWFPIEVNYPLVEALGLAILLAPLLRFSQWDRPTFQRLMLASFFIFVVIFNPAAEQPTYIYAAVGVALWFVFAQPRHPGDYALLGLMILLSSLANSDLYPQWLKIEFFFPYRIKTVPCILIFTRLQYLLWTRVFPCRSC